MNDPTPEQVDVLTELINIGIGKAGGILNDMLDAHVTLQVPEVKILTPEQTLELMKEYSLEKLSSVKISFKGNFSGVASLVFPPESGSTMVSILTGEDQRSDDLDSVRVGTLTEVGNIVINGVLGIISNIVNNTLTFSLPIYLEDKIDSIMSWIPEGSGRLMLLARTDYPGA